MAIPCTSQTVWRTRYQAGQRKAGLVEDLGLPAGFADGGRWTHGLARSLSGALLASRGEYGQCGGSQGGEVSLVQGTGVLMPLATALRNPMYLRCHAAAEVCAAAELGEDNRPGAHEKLLLLRANTHYGFPCCFGASAPVPGATESCDDVTKEEGSFALSDTPFGFDWESGRWPAPFTSAMFVALHGSAYSDPVWKGARIVYARTDPATHAPVEDWKDFLGGFGPMGTHLDRPSDIVFSRDGRMFFADDASGRVFWMAPRLPTDAS